MINDLEAIQIIAARLQKRIEENISTIDKNFITDVGMLVKLIDSYKNE